MGQHPDCDEITERLKTGEEPTVLGEEYGLSEKSLYDHFVYKHFQGDPTDERRKQSVEEVSVKFLDKLEANADEYTILGLLNDYMLKNMMTKIKEATPTEMIRFMREYRENTNLRDKLRKTKADHPTITVGDVTINNSDQFLGTVLDVLDQLCPKDQLILKSLIPGMNEGLMEHVIDPEELLKIEGGSELAYITHTQKSFEDQHGSFMENDT